MLVINSECPVCERDFSEIINKYSIKPEDEIEPAETSWIDSQPLRDIRFKNIEKEDPTEKAGSVGLIIFGLIFGLIPLVVPALVIPFPDNILAICFSYIFFIFCLMFSRFGFCIYKQLRDNPWDYLIFEESSIKIYKIDLPTRELTAENISKIMLNIDPITSNGRNIAFKISLEVTTISKKILKFKLLYRTFDIRERDQFYQYLERLIKTRYNIIIQSRSVLREWFDNNKKIPFTNKHHLCNS